MKLGTNFELAARATALTGLAAQAEATPNAQIALRRETRVSGIIPPFPAKPLAPLHFRISRSLRAEL
jgi:hypothetical protein